jgi:hypothetical protein
MQALRGGNAGLDTCDRTGTLPIVRLTGYNRLHGRRPRLGQLSEASAQERTRSAHATSSASMTSPLALPQTKHITRVFGPLSSPQRDVSARGRTRNNQTTTSTDGAAHSAGNEHSPSAPPIGTPTSAKACQAQNARHSTLFVNQLTAELGRSESVPKASAHCNLHASTLARGNLSARAEGTRDAAAARKPVSSS